MSNGKRMATTQKNASLLSQKRGISSEDLYKNCFLLLLPWCPSRLPLFELHNLESKTFWNHLFLLLPMISQEIFKSFNLNMTESLENVFNIIIKLVPFGFHPRGDIGGKTGKTAMLPWFCKIENSGSSGCAPPCYRGLIWLGHMRHASGAPASSVQANNSITAWPKFCYNTFHPIKLTLTFLSY